MLQPGNSPASALHSLDSHRTAALLFSRRDGQPALAIGREGEASPNVLPRQLREVFEDFSLRHARSQVFEHIVNRDAKPANARLAAALARLDSDDIAVVHEGNVP